MDFQVTGQESILKQKLNFNKINDKRQLIIDFHLILFYNMLYRRDRK